MSQALSALERAKEIAQRISAGGGGGGGGEKRQLDDEYGYEATAKRSRGPEGSVSTGQNDVRNRVYSMTAFRHDVVACNCGFLVDSKLVISTIYK